MGQNAAPEGREELRQPGTRLVGSVDLESIGIWVPGSRIVASTAYALPEPLEGL